MFLWQPNNDMVAMGRMLGIYRSVLSEHTVKDKLSIINTIGGLVLVRLVVLLS